MVKKIVGVLKIVWDHFGTFRNYKTNKFMYIDFITFIIVPGVVSVFFVWASIIPTGEAINPIVSALAIFAALEFNLLLLVYDISEKTKLDNSSGPKYKQLKAQLLEEIFINISFSILISFLTVLLFVCLLLTKSGIVQDGIAFFAYWFGLIFVLTQLMVLYRIYVFISHEIKPKKQ
jgi:hypothetical protein